MKHTWKRSFVFSLCLATLLLASGTPLTSYAATRTANLPQAFSACDPKVPADTGISYGADTFYSQPVNNATKIGIFSYSASTRENPSATWPYSAGIGALVCQSGDIVLLLDLRSASWFNVRILAPGWAMTVNDSSSAFDLFTDMLTIDFAGLPSSSNKTYDFSVQDCDFDDEEGTIACSQWSPTIVIVAASNSFCQNGYIWREAAPFDHVCVQPWEADQAAYDNSQTWNRGPNPYESYACNLGYVWRQAWGGDYTCVDPPQRDQVASDNSQALYRVVAL